MTDKITDLKEASLVYSLEGCRLFAGLSHQELREIAAFTVIKTLAKGDYLFHEGDESYGPFIVQKGTISIHRVNRAGKEQVIHIFRDGESFAEGSLATDKGYPAEALALEYTQLLLVQKGEFVDLLGRRPDLAMRMLGSMAMHLRDLISHIEDLTLQDVETRFVRWLLARCPDPESEQTHSFELGSTKKVLASELGTISATLSRTIGHLRAKDLLTVHGRSFTVSSPAKLGQFVQNRPLD
jgi:CRP/FNR family transcriptional regulator